MADSVPEERGKWHAVPKEAALSLLEGSRTEAGACLERCKRQEVLSGWGYASFVPVCGRQEREVRLVWK